MGSIRSQHGGATIADDSNQVLARDVLRRSPGWCVGSIRSQHGGATIADDSNQVLARDALCLLDVPTHKTGHQAGRLLQRGFVI